MDLLLALVDALDARIRPLDDRVKRLVQDDPVAQRLQTWPGIGTFGAALLLAEIGTIHRFRSAHELAACAGLTPSTQSSGDKTCHGSVGAGHASLAQLAADRDRPESEAGAAA